MASINNTPTTNAGTLALNDLVTDLVLGATTVERGLIQTIPNAQDVVEIPTFKADLNQLAAVEIDPTTANDSLHKDKIVIAQGEAQWYDTFTPRVDFEQDWKQFWATGAMTQMQLNAKIRAAVVETATASVQNNVEAIIWQGDTLGAAHLAFTDGFQKLFTADATLNKVTDLTVAITKDNILDVLGSLIAVTPAAVLELSKPTIVMSHRMKQIYFEALADPAISKGLNIMDAGVPTFRGYPIVSTGIADNKFVFLNASTGKDSNLKLTTWMWNDTRSMKIDVLNNKSEQWFGLFKFKIGLGYINSDQISYYDGTVA